MTMNTDIVYPFLRDIAEHNTREWFAQNKGRYLAAYDEVVRLITRVITLLAASDPTLAHLSARDCLFRFYRDTRFSPDKSPYKRHFGAYLTAHGRRSLRAGYYIHIQPGNTFLAAGAYCLPTALLTACRNEIMAHTQQWRDCVESAMFIRYFGSEKEEENMCAAYDEQMTAQGFGNSYLKTCPKGFPTDSTMLHYLRMKDYSCWHSVDDTFFATQQWEQKTIEIFRAAQPMMRFINNVIQDYE